jgi:hypothetical protein
MKIEWLNLDRFVHTKPLIFFYILVNLIGLFLYFLFDSNISDLARTEQRDYYDGIDGVTYFSTALPVLVLFILLNMLWGIKALIDIFRRKSYDALVAGMVVTVLWAANFVFCIYLANSAVRGGINHFD